MSSTSTAEDVPFEIRRADFFAVLYVLIGAVFLAIQGISFLDTGSFDGLFVVVSFVWFSAAGYCHLRPDSMNEGTDPAPRAWFELAGVLIALGVLAFVVLLVVP